MDHQTWALSLLKEEGVLAIYPIAKNQYVIALDGSTDATVFQEHLSLPEDASIDIEILDQPLIAHEPPTPQQEEDKPSPTSEENQGDSLRDEGQETCSHEASIDLDDTRSKEGT